MPLPVFAAYKAGRKAAGALRNKEQSGGAHAPGEREAVENAKNRRTRTRLVAGVLVLGAAFWGVKSCKDEVGNYFESHEVGGVVSPESALNNVELTDRTIIIEANAVGSTTVQTEWCPPVIGCNVPGTGSEASSEAEFLEQVIVEEGAITLSSKVDEEGFARILATVNDPAEGITTQAAEVSVQHEGSSGFFPDVAAAFGADAGNDGLFDLTDTIAVEAGERACAEALNPVVAEGIGGMVVNRIMSAADVLDSEGETAAADKLREMAERPVYVDYGIPEDEFKLNVEVTYEPGRHEEGSATMDIQTEQECMLTPQAQQQLTEIEQSGTVEVVEYAPTTAG